MIEGEESTRTEVRFSPYPVPSPSREKARLRVSDLQD